MTRSRPRVQSVPADLKRRRPHADAIPMRRLRGEEGMTLVELMVAALVLVSGMLAVAGMLATAFRTNGQNNQRVAATNLARELTEAARVASYEDLTPAEVVNAVQGASDALKTGTPWEVKRRNTVFTISASSCTFDDPADLLQTPAVADRCPLPAGTDATKTGDQNGDDFRRVAFTVAWRAGTRLQSLSQSTLVVNPAGGLGPRILPPLPALATVTNPSQASVTFNVTTTTAASLLWKVDDGVSSGPASGGPTAWSVDWQIKNAGATGAALDGTYTISLQAFSDRGIPGDTRAVDVTLNRSAPFAPKGFVGGHNTRSGDFVDLEWNLNSERDVIGYRVYDAGPDDAIGGGDDRLACPAQAGAWLENGATTCQDTTPRGGSAKYYLVALDRDTAGQPRQGATTLIDVGAPNNRPDPPEAVSLDAGPTISWTAPNSGSVAFYRIYRDGTTPEHRIGRPSVGPYSDDSAMLGEPHDYWVSAVDDEYNESDLVGPLHWGGS